MYTCPHCGEPGISKLRKLCLGPALPATYKACGKKVGVSYKALLAGLPFLAAVLASLFVESPVVKASLWIPGIFLASVIHMLWIPLEQR